MKKFFGVGISFFLLFSWAGNSGAERWWTIGTPIKGDLAVRDVVTGEQVEFSTRVEDLDAFGVDRFPCPFSKADQADQLRYQWSKSAADESGSWVGSINNNSAIWKAPMKSGRVKISVRVDDLPLGMTSDKGAAKGARDDAPVFMERWVNVVGTDMETSNMADEKVVIRAKPESIIFSDADETVERAIFLQNDASGGSVRIKKAFFEPKISGLRIASLSDTEKGCEVVVQFTGKAEADMNTTLFFEFGDPAAENVEIPITIRPLERSTVTPESVFLGVTEPGRMVEKTVSVVTPGESGITGLRYATGDVNNGLQAELQQDAENPLRYSARVMWTPKAGQAELREEMVLEALRGDVVVELIRIPCLGLAKTSAN